MSDTTNNAGFSNSEQLSTANAEIVNSASQIVTEVMFQAPDFDNEIASGGIMRLFGGWVRTIYENGIATGQGAGLGSTLLHDVLVFSNYIAMTMFIFLVMYIGWAAVMKTAADGEVMGKNWSPVWLPFRTGLAMALMYPMTVPGADSDVKVSTVQKLTLYLAFVGSELGDRAAAIVYDGVT